MSVCRKLLQSETVAELVYAMIQWDGGGVEWGTYGDILCIFFAFN